MNFLPGTLTGDVLQLPLGELTRPETVRSRLGGNPPSRVVAGIRPEHRGRQPRGRGAEPGDVPGPIDVIEWMGSELYVYFSVPQGEKLDLGNVVPELETADAPHVADAITARLDPMSRVMEGTEAELSVDTGRLVLFDHESGANLLHRGDAPAPRATTGTAGAVSGARSGSQ